jgi:hypothetical protein
LALGIQLKRTKLVTESPICSFYIVNFPHNAILSQVHFMEQAFRINQAEKGGYRKEKKRKERTWPASDPVCKVPAGGSSCLMFAWREKFLSTPKADLQWLPGLLTRL